jgi:hypothetical protein
MKNVRFDVLIKKDNNFYEKVSDSGHNKGSDTYDVIIRGGREIAKILRYT